MKAYGQFRAEMKARLAQEESFEGKDTQWITIPKLDDAVIAKIPMYALYRLCKRAEQLEKERLKVVRRAQDAASVLRRLGWARKAIGQAQESIKKAQGIYQSLDLRRTESRKTNNVECVSESVPLLSREPPWVGLLGDAGSNLDKAKRTLELNMGFLMGHKLLKKQKLVVSRQAQA